MPRAAKTTPSLVPVRFQLPAVEAETVAVCGEFNDWASDGTLLERDADGSWSVSVDLEPGRSYKYRFLLDGKHWENAWTPDAYESNAFGGHDSVVVVPGEPPKALPKRPSRAKPAIAA